MTKKIISAHCVYSKSVSFRPFIFSLAMVRPINSPLKALIGRALFNCSGSPYMKASISAAVPSIHPGLPPSLRASPLAILMTLLWADNKFTQHKMYYFLVESAEDTFPGHTMTAIVGVLRRPEIYCGPEKAEFERRGFSGQRCLPIN